MLRAQGFTTHVREAGGAAALSSRPNLTPSTIVPPVPLRNTEYGRLGWQARDAGSPVPTLSQGELGFVLGVGLTHTSRARARSCALRAASPYDEGRGELRAGFPSLGASPPLRSPRSPILLPLRSAAAHSSAPIAPSRSLGAPCSYPTLQ
jgi:hypothetical protein